MSSVTTTGRGLALGVRAPPPQHDAELKEEELLEDQPAVRRRAKRVELVERRRQPAGKCTSCERPPPIDQPLSLRARPAGADRAATPAAAAAPDARACAASSRSAARSSRTSARSGRCAASGLVVSTLGRAGGVPSVSSSVAAHDLVLRTLHLQAVRRELELAEQDHALVRMEDVVEERLVEPDRAQAAGLIANAASRRCGSAGAASGRTPQLRTSPAIDAATPGRSEAMVWKCPRSSYRVGNR